jgi:hypothetical protein
MMPQPDAVSTLLRHALEDPETAWSMGSFGAIAEFMRDPDEGVVPLRDGRLGMVTRRGAVALTPVTSLRPIAYETAVASGWNHAIALCLPEDACVMSRRTVVTEIGPDADAARAEDRSGLLFDLGLDLLAVDACVRVSDPDAIACLRTGIGRPLFEVGNPISPRLVSLSPHRVFITRIGRVEVFAPIPAPNETSPEGPHTHVLPKLLRAGRTHAATTPIPEGYVPCGSLHPAHPYKNALGQRIPFIRARHDAFQRLLTAWGDPDLLAAKRSIEAGVGELQSATTRSRFVQAARRVAEAQARHLQGSIFDEEHGEAESDEDRGHA